MSDNVTVVRELYRAFSEKDETALRQLLDTNVEWIQCSGFPGGVTGCPPTQLGRHEVFERAVLGQNAVPTVKSILTT